jgi:uncharacterized protein (TIGR04255 family)
MGIVVETPFGAPIPEIPLSRAPLVFVVAQARFERVASISLEDFIAAFQEAIRDAYPVMTREQQSGVLLSSEGRVINTEAGSVWRFDERPQGWQVSLSPDSVALSTIQYTNRGDFLRRFDALLIAAQSQLRLRFCDRLGIRYVDRLTDDQLLANLPNLVRAEVMGSSAAALGDRAVIQVHSFSDATFRLGDGSELHARWGLLPANATLDPAVPAADVRSWILDLDAYTREQERFDPRTLLDRAEHFCERIYRFFRWAVHTDFLVAHGAPP